MVERPPLTDIDLMEAREAAQRMLLRCLGRSTEDTAPRVVDAVWAALGPVAYAAGRSSLLEGAVVEYAVVYGDGTEVKVSSRPQAQQLAAVARTRGDTDAYAGQRYVTEWRPIVEGRQP